MPKWVWREGERAEGAMPVGDRAGVNGGQSANAWAALDPQPRRSFT